jgi:hypothetical protein
MKTIERAPTPASFQTGTREWFDKMERLARQSLSSATTGIHDAIGQLANLHDYHRKWWPALDWETFCRERLREEPERIAVLVDVARRMEGHLGVHPTTVEEVASYFPASPAAAAPVCSVCAAPLARQRSTRKYCSPKCRKVAWNAKNATR